MRGGERILLGRFHKMQGRNSDLLIQTHFHSNRHSKFSITRVIDPPRFSIRPEAAEEEAGRLFARYALLTLPVIDERGNFKGIITMDT